MTSTAYVEGLSLSSIASGIFRCRRRSRPSKWKKGCTPWPEAVRRFSMPTFFPLGEGASQAAAVTLTVTPGGAGRPEEDLKVHPATGDSQA